MIVVPEHGGFRIEINAVAVDGRHNAEVRLRRLFSPGQATRRNGDFLQADGQARREGRRDMGEAVGRPEGEGGRLNGG